MRRSVLTGAAVAALLLPAGAVIATSPPDSSPPESTDTTAVEAMETTPATEPAPESTAVEGSAPTDTAAAPTSEAATIYDDSGNPVAEVTMLGSESAWGDYEDGNDPEAGREYLRVTVSVASSISEGTFGVNIDDFILQDNNGFVTTAENVPTAAQAEAEEEITEEVDLASGESVELALTFEVVSSVGPQSIFYRPEDDRLVDIAEVG